MQAIKKVFHKGLLQSLFLFLGMFLVVGLAVGIIVNFVGIDAFESGMDKTKPFLAAFRYTVYLAVFLQWKRFVRFILSRDDNESTRQVFYKRRLHAMALVVFCELTFVYRFFIF